MYQPALDDIATLVGTLGSVDELSRLTGVPAERIIEWVHGDVTLLSEEAIYLANLVTVMDRATYIFVPSVAVEWLTGNNDYLDGARPIDMVKHHGPEEVLKALDLELA